MKIDILGVKIDNVTFSEAAKIVEEYLQDEKKHYIVTPNPEFVVLAQKDLEFRKILNLADLAIPDGVGLKIASAILGKKGAEGIRERVTGVDLMEKICEVAAEKNLIVGLLGGKGDVAEKCCQVLQNRFPKLRLRVFSENNPITTKTDILFVAFGAPKQEKWIFQNLPNIPVKIAMGVGGAFEMITGKQIRAPVIVRNLGLEWLWRLTNQPWRIKRQIKLLLFVYLVLKETLFGSRFTVHSSRK